MIKTSIDLFAAGVATTSSLIRWFITYMAKFKEIQEKIQLEIDRIIPRDTLPGLEHKDRCVRVFSDLVNHIRRNKIIFTIME